jgi:hypothetical protein
MREDQSPEGLIVHTAGQGDQGWYVYDVWESREQFERFVAEQLAPAIEATTRRAAACSRSRCFSRSRHW